MDPPNDVDLLFPSCVSRVLTGVEKNKQTIHIKIYTYSFSRHATLLLFSRPVIHLILKLTRGRTRVSENHHEYDIPYQISNAAAMYRETSGQEPVSLINTVKHMHPYIQYLSDER